jgi:hypothetical protein
MTRPRDRAAARRALPRFAALPLILAVLLLPALATAGARAENPAATEASGETEAWRLCVRQTSEVDAGQPMPAHLLTAISRIEAGRWKGDSQEILAWPWTVTAEGRGRFLPSKQAAIAEVEALRRRGVRNIDVGCMQINLYYHPAAFDSLEAAFDPAQNVAYALRFLVELREKWGTWTRAVGNYHSNTPRLSGKYRAKVFMALNEERRKAIEARRAARLAAREAQGDGPDRRTN